MLHHCGQIVPKMRPSLEENCGHRGGGEKSTRETGKKRPTSRKIEEKKKRREKEKTKRREEEREKR